MMTFRAPRMALGFVGNVSFTTWAQAPVLPALRERGKLLLREKVLDSCQAHTCQWQAGSHPALAPALTTHSAAVG